VPRHTVEAAAPFFARRFANLVWTILTPERSAHWEGAELVFGPGPSVPAEDEFEAMWLSYYASIFNPARPKPKAMRAEMPKRFWHNFPEAQLIAPLLAGAEERTQDDCQSSDKADRPPRRQASRSRRRGRARQGGGRSPAAKARSARMPRLPTLGAGDADGFR
jgi:hypothetical protein